MYQENRRMSQTINTYNEERNISTNPADIKGKIMKYNKNQFYPHTYNFIDFFLD